MDTSSTLVWGKFGVMSREASVRSPDRVLAATPINKREKISHWTTIRELYGVRRAIDASMLSEARARVTDLNDALGPDGNIVVKSVLAEMLAEVESMSGRHDVAERLLSDVVIPGYSGLPRFISERPRASLSALVVAKHSVES